MNLLGRWFSDTIRIGLALVIAILAMQAPALTREYASILLHVSQDARRDIEQRETSARQFYGITAETDDQLIAALTSAEPSNAETLALSIDRARTLQTAYDQITSSRPLWQPISAVRNALQDDHGYKANIWRALLDTYTMQIDFSAAAAAYGLAGLLVGSLIAQLVLAACGGFAWGIIGGRGRRAGQV